MRLSQALWLARELRLDHKYPRVDRRVASYSVDLRSRRNVRRFLTCFPRDFTKCSNSCDGTVRQPYKANVGGAMLWTPWFSGTAGSYSASPDSPVVGMA